MKSRKVNAFRARLHEGKLELDFAAADSPESAAKEGTIELNERISIPPETAQRLLLSLEEALRKTAVTTPAVSAPTEVAPQTRSPSRATVRGTTPVNAPADPAGEQAGLLLNLVAALDVPFQHERSFRIAPAALDANRYLLTVNTADVPEPALQQTLAICRQLNMPQALEDEVADSFSMANCIHFGFEGAAEGAICKLYLERKVGEAERSAAVVKGEPVLQHLAFKWVIGSGAHVVTRYFWYPGASRADIEQRLQEVYAQTQDKSSYEIARTALELASDRVPPERMQYLEVIEEQNMRRSFDLNVYEAGMQVKDMQSLLYQMRDHFEVPPGHFQALYDQIKNRSLGHLAGGVHRNALDFFNIYYGVEGFPHFNQSIGGDQ